MLKQFSYQDLKNLREVPIHCGNSENQKDGKIIKFNGFIFLNIHKILICNSKAGMFARFYNSNGIIGSIKVKENQCLEINTDTGEYFVK